MQYRNLQRNIVYMLLFALVIPILVACGSGQSENTGTTAPTPAGSAEQPTSAPASGTNAEQPTTAASGQTQPTAATGTANAGALQPGEGPATGDLAPPEQQILRVQLVAEPASIDPAQDQDTNEETVVKQFFTGLVRQNKNLEPEPAVAESWKFNSDNTQITFKLKDTKWSDGKPVTAQDFAYSWKRFLDPRTVSPYSSLVDGVIKGATELINAPISDTAKLQQALDGLGVKALDDKTLQVDLATPAPFFPAIAALGNMAPVRQDVIEKSPDKWAEVGSLVGNGPFILKNWTKGTEMTLTPNPNYYEGAPKLQTLTIQFITDDAAAFANYQADEIDIIQPPPAEIPGIRGNDQFKDQIVETSALATYFYGFNVATPPFNDLRVRQALSMAIDRKTIVDKVLNGVGKPAYSFIPPGMPGHLTQQEAGDAATAQTFDVAKAKQMLADAGFPDGKGFPELKLPFNNNGAHSIIAERMQSDLQTNLGIKVTLDPREPKTYFNDIQKNPPPFYRAGWNADYPDPFDWNRLVFGPGSSQNYGKWANSDYTKLIDQADKAQDPQQRVAYYKQAEQVLAKDVGAIFLYWYGTFRLVKPWVKGLSYTSQDPSVGAYSYKDAVILKH